MKHSVSAQAKRLLAWNRNTLDGHRMSERRANTIGNGLSICSTAAALRGGATRAPSPRPIRILATALFLLGSTLAPGIGYATAIDYEWGYVYTTYADSDKPLYVVGEGLGRTWDGVGDLLLTQTTGNEIRCTGSLLSDGMHILTAAHCLTDASGQLDVESARITFPGPDQSLSIEAAEFYPYPDYKGNHYEGNDIAIVKLVSEAPAEIPRYDIDSSPGRDVGKIGRKVGYGRSGTGNDGSILPSGTQRTGRNWYDTCADGYFEGFLGWTAGVDFESCSVLLYDFDYSPLEIDTLAHFDDLGWVGPEAIDFETEGSPDLGQRERGVPDEVFAAPGDSGSPTFIGGLIAGVTSYIFRFSSWDIDTELNSSFGEIGADIRVATYADFIDQFLAPTELGSPTMGGGGFGSGGAEGTDGANATDQGFVEQLTSIPEPVPIVLLMCGLAVLVLHQRLAPTPVNRDVGCASRHSEGSG